MVNLDGSYEPTRYWQLPQTRLSERDLSSAEAVGHLQDLLSDALRLHIRADVPVGFELSGGMGSFSITGTAAQLGAPMKVFTFSFPDSKVDEEVPLRGDRILAL